VIVAKMILAFYCLGLVALAQSPPQVATLTLQDKYLRYILITLGTPGKDRALVQQQEAALVSLLSLNSDELSALESLAARYGKLITTFRTDRHAVIASRTTLSAADQATLDGYVTKLDQDINTLTNAIMTSVRSQTAARIAEGVAGLAKVEPTRGGN